MIATLDPVVVPEKPDTTDELLKTVSASRLNCWLQCHFKFFFRYVKKISKPPTPALHVGTVVHSVLKAWNMARWRKEAFEPEKLKVRFSTEWQEQNKGKVIRWDGEEDAEKTQAWSVLEAYFQDTPIKATEKPEAVEVPVEMDLASHGLPRLIGIIDLVRAGGVIVDFKTASQTPQPERAMHQNEVQLSAYAILYREATGQTEKGLELHHLVKLKSPKIVVTGSGPITDAQHTRLFRQMESYVSGLERKDFVPAPSMNCLTCEYFQECRQCK